MKETKKVTKVAVITLSVFLLGTPLFASADTSTLKNLIDDFAQIIGTSIVGLFSGIAFAAFLWGIVRLIAAQGDSSKRQEAKKWLVWGFIGIFVMVAVWGIAQFIAFTLGINLGGVANQPGIMIISQ